MSEFRIFMWDRIGLQDGIALAQEYAEELATAINRNLSGIVAPP
jgi:hypothetical protein